MAHIRIVGNVWRMLLQSILENQRNKAELALFKAQINPHFLFNTLNSLYSLVIGTSQKAEDTFKAIEVDSLPQTVKDAVAKNYEGQTLKAAYVKDAEGVKTYKVTLVNAEGQESDVLFNEKGEVLPATETEAETK